MLLSENFCMNLIQKMGIFKELKNPPKPIKLLWMLKILSAMK
jgi:hypothetical protein